MDYEQTDAFLVDKNGQLNVFWVGGLGPWNGPQKLGPAGLANPGSFLAASQQFGAFQTDVFLVDANGQLNAFWVGGPGGGTWNGPEKLGPAALANPGSCLAVSRQFGADQTDVFLVDKNGQLNVFWVGGLGPWNGPEKLGPAGLANPGSFLAVSRQFGADQTDVFLVDKNGQLSIFWVGGLGPWNGPQKLGPAGLANPGSFLGVSQQFGADQTDVFLVDKYGQLNVFWVGGLGPWNGPQKLGPAGLANPGSFLAVSRQFGADLTDVFLVDKYGQLNVFWVGGLGPWNGPQKLGPAGLAEPITFLAASRQFGADQTDVFLVDKYGQLNAFWVGGLGPWNGPQKLGPAGLAEPITFLAASQQFAPVPAPASGLGSNSNYILYSSCKPLIDLSITVNVTQDIVWQSASGDTKGFSFQLNAYSPKNELSAWQQYCIALFDIVGLSGGALIGSVDNWPVSGPNIINDSFYMASTPSTKMIPAGYQLKISLQNDTTGNITGVTYVVTDDQGNTRANVTKTLTSISGVTSADLAPIVAFELNLVGPINGESAVLSSGAGTIVYTSSSELTVLNYEPSCTESGYVTGETANSFYGVLSATPSTIFTQSFHVSTELPMFRKAGKLRPGLMIPPGQLRF